MMHTVRARVVLSLEITVTDSETEQEACNRVSEAELALVGWDDHPHRVEITEIEVTDSWAVGTDD